MTLPAYLDTHTAIVGSSGAGKTVTAKSQVEQLLADGRHVAIIDPTGAWWGLQTNATNTGPGFDIPIFGGLYATVPIGVGDGAAVAAVIVDERTSAIVDLSEIHDAEDQRAFMADFVARIRAKPQANFHLVVDEADEFCPQLAPDKAGYRLIKDMVWLAKRGRLRGFVLTMITQRPADIQKAVLSQMQTLVAHRLVSPSDQRAIAAYLKDNAEKATLDTVMKSLASLARGERWIYSPGEQLLERGLTMRIATFDSSSTPAAGEERAQPRAWREIDASAIAAALSAARPNGTPADPIEAYDAGTAAGAALIERDAEIERLRDHVAQLEAADVARRRRRSTELGSLDGAIGDLTRLRVRLAGDLEDGVPAAPASPAPARRVAPLTTDLTPSARKLLLALASVYPRALTLAQAARLADVSTSSSQWRANVASLTCSRLVDDRGEGRFAIGGDAPMDPELVRILDAGPSDPVERWAATFTPKIAGMLRVIAAAGEALSEYEIARAAAVSPTSSTIGTGLRELRANGLIEKTAAGWLPTETLRGDA